MLASSVARSSAVGSFEFYSALFSNKDNMQRFDSRLTDILSDVPEVSPKRHHPPPGP